MIESNASQPRRRLPAAVIGLGVGRSHAEAYHQLPETELVAVCDSNEARLEPVAEQYGCRAYSSVDELLADPAVELVSVATPHPSHAELAIRAMLAGKHVLVEKPMTVDLAEADRMIAASNETGRTLGVVFQRRWWPAAMNVRRAIDDGVIGRPMLGQCHLSMWRPKGYYDRDAWRGRWDTEGGGVLVNQAIHAIDMFQWLMGGQAEEVLGRWSNLTHPYIEVEDNAVAVIRFTGGGLGVLSATTSSRLSQNSVVVHGTLGHSVGVTEEPEGAVGYNHVWTVPGQENVVDRSLASHLTAGEYIYVSGGLEDGAPADRQQVWPTAYQFKQAAQPNYHARQIQELVAAIEAGRTPLVDGVEGRKSVAILLAVYESQRTGQPVSLAHGQGRSESGS
jgi:UDP-N-acetyl-2-amino-2-deoxyglucuronate dehydrogenase